jgi:hypothetical protein
MIGGPIAFGTAYHGGEYEVEQVACLMAVQKQREKGEDAGSQYLFQEHAPRDLTSFTRKVPPLSSSTMG